MRFNQAMNKRVFDIVLACIFVVGLSPLLCLIAFLIKLTSKGSVLYWSERVGKRNTIFMMPKFRTMRPLTPKVPTALMISPRDYVTRTGSFLRRTSLDELPQLYSILKGDMSFVGPRPVIREERRLVQLRKEKGIFNLTPGLTGWAQVNGRDMLTIEEKTAFDEEYLHRQSFTFDLYIILLTAKRFLWDKTILH